MYPLVLARSKINAGEMLEKGCIQRLLLIKQTILTKHCIYCGWPHITIQP